ncbi:hypothetical protein BGZ97_002064, partial [Linnemannia gamsii]
MGEVQDDNDGEGEEIQEFGIEAILSRPVTCMAPVAASFWRTLLAPWACTMIKHLNLLVRINELRIKPGSELTPTTKTRYFEPLDQFYRQVVRLMGLQHLDLRMDMMSPSNERQEDIPTYAEVSIPGLINVGMGRPGYLELLSGLSKLKQPCGSVLADT